MSNVKETYTSDDEHEPYKTKSNKEQATNVVVNAIDSGQHASGKENKSRRLMTTENPCKLDATNEIKTVIKDSESCFACKSTLAKSPELICVAGKNHRWHPECFMCSICREPMDKYQSCHLYNEQIICRNDFIKLKRAHQDRTRSIKCARCRWPIGPSDWVRKALNFVYHLACFNCDICFRQLNTGDQFTLDAPSSMPNSIRLLCCYHFLIDDSNNKKSIASSHTIRPNQSRSMEKSAMHSRAESGPFTGPFRTGQQSDGQKSFQALDATPMSPELIRHADSTEEDARPQLIESSKTNDTNYTNPNQISSHQAHEGYTRLQLGGQRNSSASSTSSLSSSASSSPSLGNANIQAQSSLILIHSVAGGQSAQSNSCMQSSSSGSKSKRVRTTFTDEQLTILQTHFQRDSNPDGQDLERIATITGLSKRVTQVWFQNSRARQKKYMVKKKPSTIHGINTTEMMQQHLPQQQQSASNLAPTGHEPRSANEILNLL